MAVERKNKLLLLHSFLRLQLAHAAVGTYPIDAVKNAMSVNRLLMVFSAPEDDGSRIRDSLSGELFRLRPGFLYFIPCNHEIDIKLTNDLFFVSLQFNLDLFYGFDVFNGRQKCVTIENQKLVLEARRLIEREDELRTLCRVNEIIFNLCAFLLKDHISDIRGKSIGTWRNYEKELNFIQKFGDATTTVATLAKMSGMRQDVFSRKFARDMGVAPKDFITNTLMRKAAALLLTPGVNVRRAAEQLNFSSEYYFSRFFKKHTGMSPKLFMKSNGGK